MGTRRFTLTVGALMTILTRYLLLRAAGPALAAALLLSGLVLVLQVLRLGHHVASGDLGLSFVGRLMLYSLPTLALFTLPLAVAAGLLFALGRLAGSGELQAMRVAGASPLRLARPGLLLGLTAATLALTAAQLERPALARLDILLRHGAARVLLLGPRPGRFMPLPDQTTLYVQRRLSASADRARFGGFMLSQARQRSVLLAREATVQLMPDRSVVLLLSHGELQLRRPDKGLRRVRFGQLRTTLDLEPALRRDLGFVTRMAATGSQRSGSAPLACLAMALLVGCLGQLRGSRLRIAGVAVLAVVVYQAVELMVGVVWPGALGSSLVSAGVGLASLSWLLTTGRRPG